MVQINGKLDNCGYTFSDLLEIMRRLRAPDGCPWDKEQTHKSIRNNFIEETYEAVDAIDNDDYAALREELGDVLMQVAFHIVMAEEKNVFDSKDVTTEVCNKLIYRHPHVFGDTVAETSEKVLENWDKLKRTEKSQETYTDTLKSVPAAFPALMYSSKVQKRAAKASVDFTYKQEVIDILQSLLDDIKVSDDNTVSQLGKFLFYTTSLCRILKVDPEEALYKTTNDFIKNFSEFEKQALKQGGLDCSDSEDKKHLLTDI